MTVEVLLSAEYSRTTNSERRLNEFKELLKEEFEKLSEVIEQKFLLIVVNYAKNLYLTDFDYINAQFTIISFEEEEELEKYKNYINKDDRIRIDKYGNPAKFNKVYFFELRPLENCCGACVSTNSQNYRYKGKNIAKIMFTIKENIAKHFKFSTLFISLKRDTKNFTLLTQECNMKELVSFSNKRTGNNLALLIKEL
jgi:hypothetical protein